MQVIVISGKAQHGKDTTAGFLKDALEADGYSVLIAHYGDLVKYVCKMYLGWNGEKDEYGRSLLQYAGTDVVRAQNENYWVQFVGDILTFFKDKWDYVLIPDCRFPNEVNYLREVGFSTIHVRIIRDGFISPLTEQQQNHPSETALDNVQTDICFHNDGTLSDLREKVVQWVTEHNGHHQIAFKKYQLKETTDMSKTNLNSYYDIEFEVEEILSKNGLIEDIFYLKDLKQRKLFITTEISQDAIEDAVRHIMQFNREDVDIPVDERKPIILYISSNGGDVDAGFALIDVIMNSKTPVYTINLGCHYSMGFLIGLAGHKRYTMPNAKFLLHDGSNFVFDSGAKAQDQMEFNKKVESRIRDYILSRSKLTPDEYDSKYRIEWYMFSNEAKEKGFVDFIIGVDCGLDEIV